MLKHVTWQRWMPFYRCRNSASKWMLFICLSTKYCFRFFKWTKWETILHSIENLDPLIRIEIQFICFQFEYDDSLRRSIRWTTYPQTVYLHLQALDFIGGTDKKRVAQSDFLTALTLTYLKFQPNSQKLVTSWLTHWNHCKCQRSPRCSYFVDSAPVSVTSFAIFFFFANTTTSPT